MFLLQFFCLGLVLGLVLHFASSDFSDFDLNSNYDSNVIHTLKNACTLKIAMDQLSENECICNDESENNIEYSIYKATLSKDTPR